MVVFCIIQQLDSVVVGTENARRYFKGVAGNRKQYGELFGIKNMFQLHAGDSTRTMDILKVRTRDINFIDSVSCSSFNVILLALFFLIQLNQFYLFSVAR